MSSLLAMYKIKSYNLIADAEQESIPDPDPKIKKLIDWVI